mmetsp:Transcript_2252/g.4968  ORF Transcript_2252/g.4968 Transcript_2252/m.4968 type:complete len:87 (+) Transcript_2252:229-489(+)
MGSGLQQQQQQQQQQEILAPSRKKQKTKTNRHTPGTGFVPIALRCSNTETTARIRVVVCLFVCLFAGGARALQQPNLNHRRGFVVR